MKKISETTENGKTVIKYQMTEEEIERTKKLREEALKRKEEMEKKFLKK